MREESTNLLIQSDEDLATARVLLDAGRYYASVFFGQQAAEKALKAMYQEVKRRPIFTHDLVRIAEDLGAPPEVVEAARELTPDYIISRYPNAAGGVPAQLYSRKMADDHLKVCGEDHNVGRRKPPESVEQLAKAVLDLPVRLDRAILFGSRARGNHWEHSDWDVVLVSENFEDVPFPERASHLLLSLPVSDVEMFCYTPEEFEKGKGGFGVIWAACREGIELIPATSVRTGEG